MTLIKNLFSYKIEYGFLLNRNIIVEDIRIRGIGKSNIKTYSISIEPRDKDQLKETAVNCLNRLMQIISALNIFVLKIKKVFFDQSYLDTKVYLIEDILVGDVIVGPSIIIDPNWYKPDWYRNHLNSGPTFFHASNSLMYEVHA